jgi:hypothetical protein
MLACCGALIAADLEEGVAQIGGEPGVPADGAAVRALGGAVTEGGARATREVNKAEYVLSVLLRLHKISYEKDVYVWAKVSCVLGVYRLYSY